MKGLPAGAASSCESRLQSAPTTVDTPLAGLPVGDGMDLSLLKDPEGITAHNGHGRDIALPDKERRGP